MHHLDTRGADPHFTEGLYPTPFAEVFLLRFVEVKEAQQQRSATVIDHHAQGTAPGEAHVLADDTTAHQRRITGTCLRDRDVRTTILVAQRQMKQPIDRKSTRLNSSN